MIADLLQLPLRDYRVYDELSSDGAEPRSHWVPFIEALRNFDEDELKTRWTRAQRRIQENGVTYNMYSDPRGASRPWRIDLIPLLIAADEWRTIEAGVTQRAELLSRILQDLYGPRKLLLSGIIPPELVFANPAFLRPLVGVPVPAASYLHVLAVDLARSPDGKWWVVADRTQAPSGAGYALENRMIVSDVLPELFSHSNTLRLAPFFQAMRNALVNLSENDNPRIVLLTPGPLNETYFEHSYLARYLGFTLVEGADLAVRDRNVFIKTVQGLQKVDVITRRVDDSFCDPLELRPESLLGVPGLVDAIASGNVAVANALGSGLIETAAIMPFLPGVAKRLLGESLALPSVATWWCGQDYALDWVLDHLNQVVIKPAFPARPMEPVFGAELSSIEKEKLVAQMRARPFDYVAQERVALSTAPVWEQGHLLSRSLILRTYALNTGTGWRLLPGGLVRVAADEGNVVSMQRGGHSKDAWVLWDSPVDTSITLIPSRTKPIELRRGTPDVPSRVADNLFWLGRYAERSENIARLLRTLLNRVRRAGRTEFNCLLRLHKCFDSRYSKLPKKTTPTATELETELLSLMTDEKRGDSLASYLADVRRVGGNVRERLSADMTRLIGQISESVQVEEYMLFVEHTALLSGCLELLSAFSGMERENLTRGAGWLFLSLGRRLERATHSARLLREIASPLVPEEWPLLEYLLEVADSSITYKTRYLTTMQPIAVLDVLMMDETNPRSLDFQLSHIADLHEKLPRQAPTDTHAMRHAVSMLRSFDLQMIGYPLPGAEPSQRGKEERVRLRRFLRELEDLLPLWSDNLSSAYFSHARALPVTMGE
jgi:uncharacterized circularly permuted ATP-grasp superfamily protein/uncharacterized alpha-E superfamily protein